MDGRQKVKLQWIVEKKKRQAAFRKRRATLLEKASELSTLCAAPVAAVVYGPGEAEPATWPSAPEATDILQRYANLPESSKGNTDIESFQRVRIEKLGKTFDKLKLGNRDNEVNLILNDFSLGRRQNVDDLQPELAVAVLSVLQSRMKRNAHRLNMLLASQATEAAAAAAEAVIVPASQELPMVRPLAMAPMAADAPLVLPVVEPPADAGADAPLDLDGEPRHGSFLLEMVEAIMDDGSGNRILPTAEDVQRILTEHGLFKPL